MIEGSAEAVRTHAVTITATNGEKSAHQVLTLVAEAADALESPRFTSSHRAVFTVGKRGLYLIKVTPGYPVKTTITMRGKLVDGLSFRQTKNDQAAIVGTAERVRTRHLTITATNGKRSTTEDLTLVTKR